MAFSAERVNSMDAAWMNKGVGVVGFLKLLLFMVSTCKWAYLFFFFLRVLSKMIATMAVEDRTAVHDFIVGALQAVSAESALVVTLGLKHCTGSAALLNKDVNLVSPLSLSWSCSFFNLKLITLIQEEMDYCLQRCVW